MYNSILLEVIGTLEKTDIPELNKFIQSPFFNRNRNSATLVALFEYIVKFYPDLKSSKLEKEKAYAFLFPHEEIIKNKLEKLMSDLLALTKAYIIYKYSEIHQDEQQRLLALGKFYKEKKLNKRFEGIAKRLNKEKETGSTIQFYHNQFLSQSLISEFISFQNKRKRNDLNLPKTLESLDAYYILHKLQIANIMVLQNKFSSQATFEKITLLPEILTLIESGNFKDIPLIQLYYHAFYMLQKPYNPFHYQSFKTILEEQPALLSPVLLRQFQICAINFCVLKCNNGSPEYLEETFHLYKQQLLSGALYYKNKLRPSTIKNIVRFGLKMKEYDWVKTFLEEHRNRITRTKFPEDVYKFNMAAYYFHQQQYDQALDFLSDNYEDIFYNLAARRLKLKLYYEINSPILDASIDSFKALLFRLSQSSLSEDQKKLNNNFIDLLRQIQHPKTLKNIPRIEKLKEKIHTKEYIREKEWLLEKLNTLR